MSFGHKNESSIGNKMHNHPAIKTTRPLGVFGNKSTKQIPAITNCKTISYDLTILLAFGHKMHSHSDIKCTRVYTIGIKPITVFTHK